MLSNYLLILNIIVLVAMLTYVLAQDWRAAGNRLFDAYLGSALLFNITGLIRLTTDDQQLAYICAQTTIPLLAFNLLFLAWLVMVLFMPDRYAQPPVRWLAETRKSCQGGVGEAPQKSPPNIYNSNRFAIYKFPQVDRS